MTTKCRKNEESCQKSENNAVECAGVDGKWRRIKKPDSTNGGSTRCDLHTRDLFENT